jgi:peptide/nickel transport system substrate-binding protein
MNAENGEVMLSGKSVVRQCLWIAVIVLLTVSSHAAEPKRGEILRFGVRRNLSTLNPFVLMQSVNHRVRSLVYEGLLAHDQNLESLPALASSWVISPDATTYTFTLRPGVKFHTGKILSPSDVKWSIEYAQDPKNGAWGYADLTIIERIDLGEPGLLRVQLKSPFAPFLSALAGIHLFPVVPQDSLQAGESKPEAFPPGTGPFRFVSWKEGQELRLSRHEGYWQKGLPYLDEVRFIVASDDTVRMNAVRTGDLHLADEIPMEQIPRIRDGKIPGVRLGLALAGNHPRIAINHCRPPFSNQKVRQAFALALDKQEILNGAFWGLGSPTNQKLLKGTKWFVSEVPDRKQDLTKARALLAEAGHPDGLKVAVGGFLGTEKELQVIQSQLKKVGIEMSISLRDHVSHEKSHAEFPIRISGGSTSSDPDLAYYGYYHTPPPERWGQGGRVQPCYGNPRVDRLLENARRVTDFQQRRRIYREVIEILQEDVADIPIGFIPIGYALHPQVHDFEPSITNTFSYGNGGVVRTWIDK